jgi:hypothetical protein
MTSLPRTTPPTAACVNAFTGPAYQLLQFLQWQ